MSKDNPITTYVVSLSLIFWISCSTSSRFTQGSVNPSIFHASSTFLTAKSLVIIPCKLDGETKSFIFDTGAQVTAIQRDSIFGEIITVRGASNRTVENGSETVKSLMINGVDFVNTFATNENIIGLKEQIPNFGGVLGRTVIDKANWLINYPKKTIELSNMDLSDDNYIDIPLIQSSLTPYTIVEIDGKGYKAIIDLGSTSVFNVPKDTDLAEELLHKYHFVENKRERYTVGGTETITELIGTLPLLNISTSEFKNIRVNISQSSQIRLGMGFFKDYSIYIDNTNLGLSIKRSE